MWRKEIVLFLLWKSIPRISQGSCDSSGENNQQWGNLNRCSHCVTCESTSKSSWKVEPKKLYLLEQIQLRHCLGHPQLIEILFQVLDSVLESSFLLLPERQQVIVQMFRFLVSTCLSCTYCRCLRSEPLIEGLCVYLSFSNRIKIIFKMFILVQENFWNVSVGFLFLRFSMNFWGCTHNF